MIQGLGSIIGLCGAIPCPCCVFCPNPYKNVEQGNGPYLHSIRSLATRSRIRWSRLSFRPILQVGRPWIG